MILNNEKIGKENISKIIEMGTGDINIFIARSFEEKYIAVCFQQGIAGEIGRAEGNTCGMSTNEDTPDTMLIFKDIKSIDVVMEKLKKAKIILRNIKSIHKNNYI